jgi:signal transduction histidine kinase
VEQKERFMSSMSHELRTPLNGIIGLSDALLIGSCGSVSEQVLKTITTIKTSGSRLLNLINDILDAASMRKVSPDTCIMWLSPGHVLICSINRWHLLDCGQAVPCA